MLRLIATLLVLLGIAYSQAAPTEVIRAQRAFLTIWLESEDGSDPKAICSGFAVGTRVAVTAAHCVEKGKTYSVSTVDAPTTRLPVILTSRRYSAPLYDQALLTLVPEGAFFRPIPMCTTMPEVGESVWAWTGPLGFRAVLRNGIYSGVLINNNTPLWNRAVGGLHLTSVNIDSGSSGSAMLRSSGCFWGIVSRKFTEQVKLDGAIVVRYH